MHYNTLCFGRDRRRVGCRFLAGCQCTGRRCEVSEEPGPHPGDGIGDTQRGCGTQQPVLAISRKMIEQQGFTTIADVLQNLTSAGAPALSRSRTLSSGEDVGGSYATSATSAPPAPWCS